MKAHFKINNNKEFLKTCSALNYKFPTQSFGRFSLVIIKRRKAKDFDYS